MLLLVSVISDNWPFIPQFASILWCLVRTVKVFVINFRYCAIIIGAVLTLEAEISAMFW
jgi:hypothetical protein